MVCSKCDETCTGRVDVVNSADCKSERHLGCGAPWRCEDCAMDVSSASGGKSDIEESESKGILKQMASYGEEFRVSFAGLDSSFKSLQEGLAGVTTRLTAVESETVRLKKKCETVKTENVCLGRRLDNADWKMQEMERYSRMSNVMILGVTMTQGENVYALLQDVAKALNVSYAGSDVSIAHRVPPPTGRRSSHPAIVVQFAYRSERATWLAAARQKSIWTTDLQATFPPGPVYVKEHLTLLNKDLPRRGKSLAKSGVLAFAWCRDSKVLVRRSENSKVQRILRSFDELEEQAEPDASGAERA